MSHSTSLESPSIEKPLSPGWALLLSALSAFLLYLSFPAPAIRPLIFVALAPLFLALRNQGLLRGALVGGLHGVLYQSVLLFWANFFGPAAFAFLVVYKSVGPALFGALMGWVRPRRPLAAWAWFGAAWVALEYYQMLGPFGITWGMLSHALARYPSWIQVGSLFGPWALSLVIALVNAALAQWLWDRRRGRAPSRAPALASLALAGLTFAYGLVTLATAPPPGPGVTFGAIQVCMGREVKWDQSFAEQTMGFLETLTRQAAQQGATIIVWPETTIPYRNFLKSPPLTYRVGLLGLETGTYIIAGSIELVGDGDPNSPSERKRWGHTYNTASLITPQGRFADRYDKQRLVPGGEYLPLERFLGEYRIFDRVMNYRSGDHDALFSCGDQTVGVLICYESMVPYLATQRAAAGASLLVISTNDAWFGKNAAIYHHFEMAIMRAVESRRSIVQAGNTGVSAIVDRYGRVTKESVVNQREVLVGSAEPYTGQSLYTRIGDVLAWFCLLYTLLGAWLYRPRSRG